MEINGIIILIVGIFFIIVAIVENYNLKNDKRKARWRHINYMKAKKALEEKKHNKS